MISEKRFIKGMETFKLSHSNMTDGEIYKQYMYLNLNIVGKKNFLEINKEFIPLKLSKMTRRMIKRG